MTESRSAVRIEAAPSEGVPVLALDGVLDSSTYRSVRDGVIKAALDEPRAVVVDVNRLTVPSASAWTVFTSARWHVSTWPDVPIVLVCDQPRVWQEIAAGGVARYVPVHSSREGALQALRGQGLQLRRRARSELPATRVSVGLARAMVTDWLHRWEVGDLAPVAATMATVFVENVLEHTESAPALIVENHRQTVTVAVEDCSTQLPGRHEDADRGAEIVSGLAIVAALSRAWGATPTSTGKTVWAMVGRESAL